MAASEDAIWEVIVVGAGAMGSATAWRLAKKGIPCLLLEQYETTHDRGSSHGRSRIIRRTYPQDHYTRAMDVAYDLWEELDRDAEVHAHASQCTESYRPVCHPTGGLDFARTGNAELESLVESCRRNHVPHELLTPRQVSEKYPIRLPDDYRAVYSPDGGVIEASRSVGVFQQLAVASGATIQSNTVLRDATESSNEDCVLLHVTHDNSEKIIRAKSVVLCLGAWAGQLLPSISCLSGTPLSRIPLRPKKVTVMYWNINEDKDDDPAAKHLFHIGKFPIVIDYENGAYGLPAFEHPHLMKVCDHDGVFFEIPEQRDSIPHIQKAAEVVRQTLSYLPGIDATQPALMEDCMYCMTPDADFVVDSHTNIRHPSSDTPGENRLCVSRICVGAGFSGHGFKLAPLIGDVLARLSQGETPVGLDMEKLSASRVFPKW
mmetsp:Transcript_45030/g.54124  ORF Transcript_45030/g.54124 Transcript_45030/m.54124 type:complete len:432 (-) Transcript_45030:1198-2493(-)|eukprot:CAMPEP_0194386850 /NCGR_PEP_ID=MMETSP0174-20130528/88781_1 /TAXON_ID=216777 /ORGANISM="Proboscia alata, Strain PI-D3" /LENGTH=431 /DNA_ID=CAMNT_0039176443 /DNA_START=103 /DNA_END=1398 /DNA_ORIENTATION=-